MSSLFQQMMVQHLWMDSHPRRAAGVCPEAAPEPLLRHWKHRPRERLVQHGPAWGQNIIQDPHRPARLRRRHAHLGREDRECLIRPPCCHPLAGTTQILSVAARSWPGAPRL